MENIENNNLKKMLSVAREAKGLSQRKLARIIGIHHSSLNDLENGRIKKIDVEVLRRIADELDLDYEQLLENAGYNQVVSSFKDTPIKIKKKSKKDLLTEYRMCKYDLLQDAYDKRQIVAECRARLFSLMFKLKDYDLYKAVYTPEVLYEEVKSIYEELAKSAEKYDYSKLPKE